MISITPSFFSYKKSLAFTLLELLIVLLIVAVIAGVATLSVGRFSHQNQAKKLAQKIYQALPLAREYALLRPVVLKLVVEKNDYAFYQFDIAGKTKDDHWKILEKPHYLKSISIPDGVVMELEFPETSETSKQKKEEEEALVISPTFGITPFALKIGTKKQPNQYQISTKENGVISLDEKPEK